MAFLDAFLTSLKKLFSPLSQRKPKPQRRNTRRSHARSVKPRRRPKSAARKGKPFRRKTDRSRVAKPSGVASHRRKRFLGPVKAASKAKAAAAQKVLVGEVTHFFPRIQVVVLKLKGAIQRNDLIHIKGATTDFSQKVASLQIESRDVAAARKGQMVGLKVDKPARVGDRVYKI